MNWITKIINDLISRNFYGKITISFENGKITMVKKEETMKPS